MLKRLSISDYVIIKNLAIDFTEGLTVLTGETGAGKSILLDALGLILGDEPDRETIRQDAHEMSVEALFVLPLEHPAWVFLSSQPGLTLTGPELLVRRIIGGPEKDDMFVGGIPVVLPVLKELGTHLVEIHGQFANQNFLAPESQLSLLDAFGAYPPEILGNVARALDDITRIERELEEERIFLAQAEQDKSGIERLIIRVQRIGLKKEQYLGMKAELENLINNRDMCELFQTMNAQLIAQTGVEMSLARLNSMLQIHRGPGLDKMRESIGIALDQTRIAVAEMHELAPQYSKIDFREIQAAEKKLADIHVLAAEHKISPEAFFDHYENLAQRLARIRSTPARIKELDGKLLEANKVYWHHASVLSEERGKAAEKLSKTINMELVPLKLLGAEVRIDVSENRNERTRRGINKVAFMARMNPGMPFSPVDKTASGGELARLILAIKMILQRVQAVPTLVFDEIDTGIGGAAAAAVGSRIARLAEAAQILVITHSPQVAARGDRHLHVSKQTDNKTTQAVVNVLTMEKRIGEVARMLAGEKTTDESVAAARMLIEEASHAALLRKNRSEGISETILPPSS